MANGRDANSAISVNHLIDNAIGTNSEGPKPPQPTTKQMSCIRFALKQTQRLRHCIDQRPIETQQLATGSPSEYNSRHS
jgi:hypothetical protein